MTLFPGRPYDPTLPIRVYGEHSPWSIVQHGAMVGTADSISLRDVTFIVWPDVPCPPTSRCTLGLAEGVIDLRDEIDVFDAHRLRFDTRRRRFHVPGDDRSIASAASVHLHKLATFVIRPVWGEPTFEYGEERGVR